VSLRHAASDAAGNALEYGGRCIGDCGVIADGVQGVQFSWNETIVLLPPVERLIARRDGADRVTRCVAKRRAVSRSRDPVMTMS
jgi:hypothetical protein